MTCHMYSTLSTKDCTYKEYCQDVSVEMLLFSVLPYWLSPHPAGTNMQP